MNSLKFRVGRGWRDQMPPAVKEVLTLHDHEGKSGVMCVRSDAHLEGFQGSSDVMFYDPSCGPSVALETVANVFNTLGLFFAELRNTKADVASIIFLNRAPQSFTLADRPEPASIETESMARALEWFCQNVRGSIEGERMWSACEWVMLSGSPKI